MSEQLIREAMHRRDAANKEAWLEYSEALLQHDAVVKILGEKFDQKINVAGAQYDKLVRYARQQKAKLRRDAAIKEAGETFNNTIIAACHEYDKAARRVREQCEVYVAGIFAAAKASPG